MSDLVLRWKRSLTYGKTASLHGFEHGLDCWKDSGRTCLLRECSKSNVSPSGDQGERCRTAFTSPRNPENDKYEPVRIISHVLSEDFFFEQRFLTLGLYMTDCTEYVGNYS